MVGTDSSRKEGSSRHQVPPSSYTACRRGRFSAYSSPAAAPLAPLKRGFLLCVPFVSVSVSSVSNTPCRYRSSRRRVPSVMDTKRTNTVKLVLNDEEKQVVARAAEAAQLPLAQWVRLHIVARARTEVQK